MYYYLKWCTDTKKNLDASNLKKNINQRDLKREFLHSTTVSQQYRNTKVRKMMDCGATDIGKGKGKKNWTKYPCPHGKKKYFCELCNGKGLCEHKKSKYNSA